MYGSTDTSRELLLDNAQNNFERAKTDIFGVETVFLGDISKIRLRSDGSGIGSDWFVDKVIIHSEKDNKDFFFLFGKWISEKDGLSQEIGASDKDGNTYLPLVKYRVDVKTGTQNILIFCEILSEFY